MSAEVILRLENVKRRYGSVLAVADINLELHKGEILTLLGPSGCGKTTTLRMAVGLERSTGGRIHYKDRLVDSVADKIFVPPEKRDMGMVFQSYAIWPHLNVFENIAFPLRVKRTPNQVVRQKVEEALEMVGLSGFEDRPGTRLSGGQQQRVAVARGLVSGSDILLMDEPFSNLDAKLREQMRAELKLLQRRLNISILFVTHDQAEALALSDRLAIMNAGRIEQIGTPTQLYNYPTTASVRDFLGRTLLFPARIDTIENGQVVAQLDLGWRVTVSGRSHTSNIGVGCICQIAIKPEEIFVQRASEPQRHDMNTIDATISAVLFLGQHYEAAVDIGGKTILIFLPRTTDWQEGEKIRLHLPPEKIQLWQDGSST